MLRGLNTAVTGMIATQRRHDVITNNIANANTPGFKTEQTVANAVVESTLLRTTKGRSGETMRTDIGSYHLAMLAQEAPALFAQGDLMETGRSLDVALDAQLTVPGVTFDASGKSIQEDGTRMFAPQAFFVLQTPDGEERYSRHGQWTVDAAGRLLGVGGMPVLGANRQPITLNVAPADLRITDRGTFVRAMTGEALVDETGQPLTVAVVRIDNPQTLIREGEGVWRRETGATEQPPAVPPLVGEEEVMSLRQGFVERSNVDVARASVDLMTAQRAYESNQKVVQWLDRTLDKAVNEVGRV